MKRHTLTRAALAAGIVALMVLAPTPALAVQPVPPGVEAVPLLPSTTLRMTQGASGGWTVKDYFKAYAILNQPTGLATIPKPAPIPITPSSAMTGLVASPAGVALNGWFAMAGAGAGVKFVGEVVGADLNDPMCGLDSWVQTGYGFLTMGQGPSCSAPFGVPNSDVVPGTTLSYGGSTWQIVYTHSFGSPTVGWGYCTTGPTTFPAGTQFALRKIAGTWQGVGLSAATSGTYGCVGRNGATGQFVSDPATYGDPPLMGIRRTSDGVIVAQQQATNTNPQRTGRCSIDWEDGTSTSATIGTYTQTAGFPVGGIDSACTEAFVSKPGHGPGLMPSRIKIGSTNDDTGAQTEIANQEVPEFTEAEREGLDPGDGTGLKLWKITAAGKSSCMTWATDCRGWWTKTDEATNEGTDAEKFRCEFGGKKVALAECGVYRNTFDEQTSDAKVTDPETGETVDWSSLQEGTANSTDPGDALTPGQRCLLEWSEVPNPIEFVLQPVKCALVWAFVPRPAKVDEFGTKLDQKWKQSSPGQLATAFVGIGLAFEALGDGNCGGIPIQLPTSINADGTPDTEPAHFMAACSGILQPVATATYWIMTVSIAIIGFVAIKVQLDRFVGNT